MEKTVGNGVCITCGKRCKVKRVDEGVGPIEVHGHREWHHDWKFKSVCCTGEVEEMELSTEPM